MNFQYKNYFLFLSLLVVAMFTFDSCTTDACDDLGEGYCVNGSCTTNVDGDAFCLCDEGWSFDADGKCTEPSAPQPGPCVDSDCPDNSSCDDFGDCVCDYFYVLVDINDSTAICSSAYELYYNGEFKQSDTQCTSGVDNMDFADVTIEASATPGLLNFNNFANTGFTISATIDTSFVEVDSIITYRRFTIPFQGLPDGTDIKSDGPGQITPDGQSLGIRYILNFNDGFAPDTCSATLTRM